VNVVKASRAIIMGLIGKMIQPLPYAKILSAAAYTL
jgi:hypothetical protein